MPVSERAEKQNEKSGTKLQMKLHHVVMGGLLAAVFCTPVGAQEGFEDEERFTLLGDAYRHLATKVDVEGVRIELVAIRLEVQAAAQITQEIVAVIAGLLLLVLGGGQVWIVSMLRGRESSVGND